MLTRPFLDFRKVLIGLAISFTRFVISATDGGVPSSSTFESFELAESVLDLTADANSTLRALLFLIVDSGNGGRWLRGFVIVSGSFSEIVTRFLEIVDGRSSMRPRPPDDAGELRGRFAGRVDWTW